jgi:hypothetical protein
MMENLCLVAALAQRPAKWGKQWGRETRASETQRRAAARKGEQIRKAILPNIDTSHDMAISLYRSGVCTAQIRWLATSSTTTGTKAEGTWPSLTPNPSTSTSRPHHQ